MFDFWIWLIEKFDLFYGFEPKQIENSFNNLFEFVLIFVFIVSVIIFYKLFRSSDDPDDLWTGSLLCSVFVSFFVSAIIVSIITYIYTPRDPESLIKTTQIKKVQTVIIPSEGVTEASLKLKDSDEKIHPSTLKDGEILTLTVTADGEQFKKDFPYKKENLKIKKGKSGKVTSGVLVTRSFKDELFNHERIREEEDVILEIETADPFYNPEN